MSWLDNPTRSESPTPRFRDDRFANRALWGAAAATAATAAFGFTTDSPRRPTYGSDEPPPIRRRIDYSRRMAFRRRYGRGVFARRRYVRRTFRRFRRYRR